VNGDTFRKRCEAALTHAEVSEVELRRYQSAIELLRPLRSVLSEPILDFGASYGLSMLALATVGVRDSWGVEPDGERVSKGVEILSEVGLAPERLQRVPDTRTIPFSDSTFESVLALAVFEHIPQPRSEYIAEIWRLLKPGGHCVIAETPNKYFPVDLHTTGLPLIPWLPSRMAHALGKRFGKAPHRYDTKEQWASSGWRGMGYHELISAIPGEFSILHTDVKRRHHILRRMRLFPGLIDPYPVYILRKE